MSLEKPMVILTMTTIPNRINNSKPDTGIGPVIERLTTLSYDNYEVHLNVPYINKKTQEEYIIPAWIMNKKSNILKIFRTEDYGPITKILPTIERIDNPDQIIITIDDDLEYMDGFIEYHIEKRKQYPDCALGFAGIDSIDESYDCHFCTSVKQDVRVKVMEGYKTVSYLRKFFTDDYKEILTSTWSDDIAISAYLGKHNIKKIVLYYDKDIDFSPRVESFPVVRILPNEYGGCWHFRNENISDNHEIYYQLGYLEK